MKSIEISKQALELRSSMQAEVLRTSLGAQIHHGTSEQPSHHKARQSWNRVLSRCLVLFGSGLNECSCSGHVRVRVRVRVRVNKCCVQIDVRAERLFVFGERCSGAALLFVAFWWP